MTERPEEFDIQIRDHRRIQAVSSSSYPGDSTKEQLMEIFSEILDEFFSTRDRLAAKSDDYWMSNPDCTCGHSSSMHTNEVRMCYYCPTGACNEFKDIKDE